LLGAIEGERGKPLLGSILLLLSGCGFLPQESSRVAKVAKSSIVSVLL
jgi:hypothetical protein